MNHSCPEDRWGDRSNTEGILSLVHRRDYEAVTQAEAIKPSYFIRTLADDPS